MEEYDIAVDFESWHTTIYAENKEEAEKKALEEYAELRDKKETHPHCWVGECEEVRK